MGPPALLDVRGADRWAGGPVTATSRFAGWNIWWNGPGEHPTMQHT
jgi:hypothetical protein